MGAFDIVAEQMHQMSSSGLLDACSEMHVGINGGEESLEASRLILPEKAKVILHGLESKAENLTLVELMKWSASHPGWFILYAHSKSATHEPGTDYHQMASNWRRGMMEDLVTNWRQCVADLQAGADIACSHWMWGMGSDQSQHIPAGNCLWVKSDFVNRLPSIYLRDRIKVSGIASAESRFEAEVLWGNGPRPIVKQYRPNGGGGVP